jgi:nicotinamide-nucleotide amidase
VNAPLSHAFIISQGEELLTGQTLDTNANFLADQLTALGLKVRGTLTAGDRLDAIAQAFMLAEREAGVVLCTGGLGPTGDDLTAEAIARAFDSELLLDATALEQIRDRYKEHGRPMARCNEKQAMLPRGSTLLPNPLGTAPGFHLKTPTGCRIFCLPGVPHEMRRMWHEEVRPILCREGETQPRLRHLFRTIGQGESQLQELLGSIPDDFPGVQLGFRARSPENEVKLEAETHCSSFSAAVERCRKLLGQDTFSEDAGLSLAARIGELLVERGERLALAESCTGGWIGHLCVTEAGSSLWFDRGSVTYSNAAKTEMVGVSQHSLERYGAVSDEVALEMAQGAAKTADVDWGLAVTGVAGPGGGSEEKPVGTVHVAVAGPGGERVRKLFLPTGSRTMTRQFSAFIALDMLRRQILRLRR